MTLQEMIDNKTKLEAEAARIKTALSQVEGQIDDYLKDSVRERLAVEEKDTGTVNFNIDGIEVKAAVPKTVKWDQKRLAEIAVKIASAGDDPENYMKVKREVSKTSFKAWPTQIQNVFMPARTVVTGKTKYTFGNGNGDNGKEGAPWE
jgi:hypothetical protein